MFYPRATGEQAGARPSKPCTSLSICAASCGGGAFERAGACDVYRPFSARSRMRLMDIGGILYLGNSVAIVSLISW
jgi:hypothetical protein